MRAYGSSGLSHHFIACVLITHLPAKVELSRNPELKNEPFLIIRKNRGKRIVLDYSRGIQGVSKGMPLQQALSRSGDVQLIQANESYYQREFNSLINVILQSVPDLEQGELGRLYVDLKGLECMYGDETRLITKLLEAIPINLRPRVGIADGKFPAYISAILAKAGEVKKPPQDVREFLGDQPLRVLPARWRTKKRLHMLGFRTIGEVAALGIGPLQAQFGKEGYRIWELANGTDTSPLIPMKPYREVSEWLSFSTPTQNLSTILVALELLLDKAFGKKNMGGELVRRIILEAQVLGDNAAWRKEFVFKRPVNSSEGAFFPLKGMLESLTLPGPLEELKLTLLDITGDIGMQVSMLSEVRQQAIIEKTVEELSIRLRATPPIYHIRSADLDSIIPEYRKVLISIGSKELKAVNRPVPIEVWRDRNGRPTDVRTGKYLIPVQRIVDVWEIQSYWWREKAVARKYYRVVLDNGEMINVYFDPVASQWYQQKY